jgi:hypothetical protein
MSLHSLFAKGVFALDRRLQEANGIFCYSSDPECMFRMAFTRLEAPVVLQGGLRLKAGDPIARLHIWNEQMPAMRGMSPVRWGIRSSRRFAHSLGLLAAYLASLPDCSGIAAIGADMALGTAEGTAQLLRICARHGLVPPCEYNWTGGGWAHRLGENILISMLVLAQNPQAFRLSCLRRVRVPVFMSRAELDRRFGVQSQVQEPAS